MPHVTEHTPKVSTRSVKPYAREIARGKSDRKTARQTDTQTGCPKPLFSTFWGLYIPNPVLSRSRFFARCQYFHWHGSKIEECVSTVRPVMSESPSWSIVKVMASLGGSPQKSRSMETVRDRRVSKQSAEVRLSKNEHFSKNARIFFSVIRNNNRHRIQIHNDVLLCLCSGSFKDFL